MESLRTYTILLFSVFVIFWIDENYIHAFPYSQLVDSFFTENKDLIFIIWVIIAIIVWGLERKKNTNHN